MRKLLLAVIYAPLLCAQGPLITTLLLPNGTVGAAYNQTLTATLGRTPYTWSTSAGALPDGLSLNAGQGRISGTPTAPGSFNFTIKVTDRNSATDSQALAIVVDPAPVTISTTSLPNGTVGAAYSQTLAATGGVGNYSWTVILGSLPAGLSLSPAGTITGTPTSAGTSTFTVQVKDGSNVTTLKAVSINVAAAPLIITTDSLPGATVGTAYSQSLAANGGTGPYTWTVSAGALPAGLSLSTAGAITGTPTTAGTANFTAQVKDTANVTVTKALSIVTAAPPLTVSTASLPDGTVGTAYSQSLTATGGTGGYTWTVSAGALPAGLSLSAAGAITGTPTAAGTANFTAQVKDSANTTATKALTINIAVPALTVTTSTLPGGTVATAYSQTLAASGGTGGYTWTVSAGALPAGLSLSTAGAITGTPTTAGTANFTAQVKDSANTNATKALSIVIAAPALGVSTASLPEATVGTAYSQTLAATGGTGGYTWTISAGALPAGLSLSTAGAITGTPTNAGTANFTVQVKDSANTTATKALGIIVVLPVLTVSTASLPDATVGTAYSQTLTASGGSGGYTWTVSAGALPAGLSLSTAGAITGTPTTAGTANFTVQVKDSANTTATKALAINIAAAALTVTTTSLPSGVIGTAYSQTLTASGGSGGYTWTVSTGALPAGLSLSTAGAITGTPTTAGTANFTVQVRDSANTTATKALSIVIAAPALTVTTASLLDGVVGAAYSQTLAASGGTGPYTWTVSAGALPAGLSLSTAGAITGTPTTAGTANFTVQAKDSANATASKALGITIAGPALTVTTTSLPAGVIGTAYSQTLTGSGGTGPYSWTLSAGALPAGLALSTAGAITGTPTTAGTANFTVQAKDSANATATKALAITIAGPALTVTTTSLPDGVVGAAYSQTLAALGGTGTYTWTVTAGALPGGLSLSTAGAITGTPTTAGAASFTVQAKDSANASVSKALSITIAPSPVVITTANLPNAAQGASYSQVLAATGGTGTYRWTVSSGSLPGGLTLDASGRIAGIPTGTTSSFTVQAADTSGLTASRNLTITVAPAISITSPASLPGGVVGVAYSTTLTANGGTPPYTFSIASGQLPAGITLNATSGALTGTPTLAGSYAFTLQVTDSANASVQAPFGLNVRSPLTITTAATLANGSVGALYRQTLAVSGGVPPYAWSLTGGALPTGLSINPGTGELSGTPSQAGTFPITVQVRDAAGTQVEAKLNLTIVNGLTITTPPVLPVANQATSYQITLESAGGAAPYIWSVTAGSLPAGLTFHADGKIDGNPTTAGTFTFTAQVVDANSSRASKDFTLTVAGALVLTSPGALPDGATGVAYATTIAGAGGTPPYVFTLSAGTAPPGLTLEAPTGALVGTPTTTGAFRFTVTLTDAAGLTTQKEFTVTISPGLSFTTPAALPAATAGTPYTFTIAAAGGQQPYSYRISSGALPDGLTLNASNGVVSGTPSVDGTFNFTVEVTDAAKLTVSRVHSLVVSLPSVPSLSLDSIPTSLNALQQPVIDLTLASPYPVAINGRLNLQFTPAGGMPDDPSVQFSSGGRTVAFTIPANSTHAVFPTPQFAIQTGSEAGTISFTVESLDAAGNPLPAPSSSIRSAQIAPAAPVIRSVTVTRTSGGFDVTLVGLSNTRELKQATVRFHAAAGSNLQTSEVTIPLTEPAKSWFASGNSSTYGGQFTLTLPFSIVGGGTGVADSVTVILTNSVGDSTESGASVP